MSWLLTPGTGAAFATEPTVPSAITKPAVAAAEHQWRTRVMTCSLLAGAPGGRRLHPYVPLAPASVTNPTRMDQWRHPKRLCSDMVPTSATGGRLVS
ncbi:MAG: hypothetical protein QOF44_954 [Streptomyces sp.]|nr:hypothetical protein [Streptomyces sp.]